MYHKSKATFFIFFYSIFITIQFSAHYCESQSSALSESVPNEVYPIIYIDWPTPWQQNFKQPAINVIQWPWFWMGA